MSIVIVVYCGRMRRTACGVRGVPMLLCVVGVEGYNKEIEDDGDGGETKRAHD